jgi:phosphopantetheine adenylyltransferase
MSEQSKRIESKIRYYAVTAKQLIKFIIRIVNDKAHLFNIDDHYGNYALDLASWTA